MDTGDLDDSGLRLIAGFLDRGPGSGGDERHLLLFPPRFLQAPVGFLRHVLKVLAQRHPPRGNRPATARAALPTPAMPIQRNSTFSFPMPCSTSRRRVVRPDVRDVEGGRLYPASLHPAMLLDRNTRVQEKRLPARPRG